MNRFSLQKCRFEIIFIYIIQSSSIESYQVFKFSSLKRNDLIKAELNKNQMNMFMILKIDLRLKLTCTSKNELHRLNCLSVLFYMHHLCKHPYLLTYSHYHQHSMLIYRFRIRKLYLSMSTVYVLV